ncbi:MAG: hypothetical protein JKY48_04500, partial [Flavobacteriales bacterium]|nr:hypothetical protein [Flavobacteriales bacterium]
YDKLAIDFYGLGDIKLQSGFSFKEPGFNLQEIGSLFKDLIQFCTNPEFKLDPEKVYEDFNLTFKVLPNYIETGDYMGKEVFGLKKGFDISLYKIVAHMLNGIKFFNIVDFIQSIPLNNRVGEAAIATDFLGMNAEGKFLLVSPEEFIKNKAYEQILPEATDEDARKFMEILPSEGGSPIQPEDKGLILFLKGMWNTDYSKLDTAFGLIAIDNKRFNTGFYLKGEIANLFDIDLLATLQIDPPETPFKLHGAGKTNFKILDVPIFSGETMVTADTKHFKIGGSFSLLEGNSLVYLKTTEPVEGEITQSGLIVKGAIEGRFLIFTASGSVDISQEKIAMDLKFLNESATFLMTKEKVDWQKEKVEAIHVKGDIKVLWSHLNVDVFLIPEKNHLRSQLNSSIMNHLISLNASFDVDINQSHIGARGNLEIYVLKEINPKPVFQQEMEIDAEGMYYSGDFRLLPEAVPFDLVSANMKGRISEKDFYLRGKGSFDIGLIKLAANINLNNEGIRGDAEGMFLLYYLRLQYDIKFGEGLISMGQVDMKMAGIPLFSGQSIFNDAISELNLKGQFSLLDLGSLLYIKSIEPMTGHIAPGVLQTKGNIEARLLIFHAKGTAEMGTETTHLGLEILGVKTSFTFSLADDHLFIAGTIPVGWNNLSASFRLYPMPVNKLITTLESASIANLIRLKLQFETTLNQSYIGAKGKFYLYLLEGLNPNPVLNGTATIDHNGFQVTGQFQLFPDNSPINVKATVKEGSRITDKGLFLYCDATIEVLNFQSFRGEMTIDNNGISGSVSSILGTLKFGIINCRGSLHIYGSYYKCEGTPINFLINDQFPFFHPGQTSPCAPRKLAASRESRGMLFNTYKNANELLAEVMMKIIKSLTKNEEERKNQAELVALYDREILNKYHLKISDVDAKNSNAENKNLSIMVSRLANLEIGLFEDIQSAVKEKCGIELNISEASIKWNLNMGNDDPQKLVMRLPQEANSKLQELELDVDIFNSKRFMVMVIIAVNNAME